MTKQQLEKTWLDGPPSTNPLLCTHEAVGHLDWDLEKSTVAISSRPTRSACELWDLRYDAVAYVVNEKSLKNEED